MDTDYFATDPLSPFASPVLRATHLTRLTDTLRDTRRAAEALRIDRPDLSEDMQLLMARIDVLSGEIEILRLGLSNARREINPKWRKLAHWRGNIPDPA